MALMAKQLSISCGVTSSRSVQFPTPALLMTYKARGAMRGHVSTKAQRAICTLAAAVHGRCCSLAGPARAFGMPACRSQMVRIERAARPSCLFVTAIPPALSPTHHVNVVY